MNDILTKKLRQVAALIDRAEHPNTPPAEADEARKMADRLMAKYKIEEEEIRQTAMAQGTETIKPIVDEGFPICRYDSEYRNNYASLLATICSFVGNVKLATQYDNGQYAGIMVGFESDVKHAQTLYTSLRLHFANTLEPEYNPNESDMDNVYRLRSAGLERGRVGQLIWGPDGGKKHLLVGTLYKEACAARGEDAKVSGRSVNAKKYRAAFADGYVGRISSRLWRSRLYNESGEMVLAGREEAVLEAWYERFPQWRPRPDRELGEGTTGGPGGDCPKCNKTKSGYCRDHMWMKPSNARGRGESTSSMLGYGSGGRAADTADLGLRGGTGRIES